MSKEVEVPMAVNDVLVVSSVVERMRVRDTSEITATMSVGVSVEPWVIYMDMRVVCPCKGMKRVGTCYRGHGGGHYDLHRQPGTGLLFARRDWDGVFERVDSGGAS